MIYILVGDLALERMCLDFMTEEIIYESILNADTFIKVLAASMVVMILAAVFQFSYIISNLGDEKE